MSELFRVSNHQSEDWGRPPQLPDDFDTGNYYRGYFENPHGEQWLFWYDYGEKKIHLHGGDLGWATVLQPARVNIDDLMTVFQDYDGLANQVALAGVTSAPIVLLRLLKESPRTQATLVVDEQGNLCTLNMSERVWLDACLVGCRQELVPLTVAAIRQLMDRLVSLSRTGSDGELVCDECGQTFAINTEGIAQHLDEDGDIDFDQDADHVPFQLPDDPV